MSGVEKVIKRLLDLSGAAVGLVVASPVMALSAIAVRVFMGSPILFRQTRPGYKGRPFTILKFRTMDVAGTRGDDSDSARLTRLGTWLRRTSVDELPQLINVLRGEMSFVGPRPLLMEYMPLYDDVQARRHDVKPGLTGWAQVHGRNSLSWQSRFGLDVWYVDNQSVLLDLRILCLTVAKVLSREGTHLNEGGKADRFGGSGA